LRGKLQYCICDPADVGKCWLVGLSLVVGPLLYVKSTQWQVTCFIVIVVNVSDYKRSN